MDWSAGAGIDDAWDVEVSRVRAALLVMAESDQAVRAEIDVHTAADGTIDPQFLRRWQDLDRRHTAVLCEIVAEHGWPGLALVGIRGAEAAWLLAQHADLDDQRVFRPLLQAAVQAGDATVLQLAFLDDRIAMREGRPQWYGTQMIRQGTSLFRLYEVEEPDTLDARRAEIGLGPVADQLAHVNRPALNADPESAKER